MFFFFTLTVSLHTCLNFKSPLNPPESKRGLNSKHSNTFLLRVPAGQVLPKIYDRYLAFVI